MIQIFVGAGGSSTAVIAALISSVVAVCLFFVKAWLDQRTDAIWVDNLLSVSIKDLTLYCRDHGDFREELRSDLLLFEKNLEKLSGATSRWTRYLSYRRCCYKYIREKSLAGGGDRSRIAAIADELDEFS
jgi:hypothetical protein